ncbi:MAG: hypothetical protein JNK37_01105 [Verrucomicrobiales bacterium]|nr:hypothetical protein [Verrucomicrobiales bacterium]
MPTAIVGDNASDAVRQACQSLNRERTRGLLAIAQQTPPGESIPADVWTTAFESAAREWEVPPIRLSHLGIVRDSDGFLVSNSLRALPPGAEAQPYADDATRVVYKLFDLRENGSLGKKLVFNDSEDGFEVDVADATWIDVLEKISLLNSGGGLPTEIVGLSDSGDFLIAKQPMASPWMDFLADREVAEDRMCGILPIGGGLRQRVFVTWVDDVFWLVGDLHDRNIMRDSAGVPAIIDALAGKVTPKARKRLFWLNRACEDAKSFRENGSKPQNPMWEVCDDQL